MPLKRWRHFDNWASAYQDDGCALSIKLSLGRLWSGRTRTQGRL